MLRLTEKLISRHTESDVHSSEEKMNSADSICQFVLKLLNTRQGSVLINPNLGMPAFDISQGLQDESDKLLFLQHIAKQIKLAEPRVVDVQSQLKQEKNITVVMAFKLEVKTVASQSVHMLGKLQSDSTFELELI